MHCLIERGGGGGEGGGGRGEGGGREREEMREVSKQGKKEGRRLL